MDVNCNVIDDLLPLYADGACSNESRALIEAHLESCPACRDKLRRMQSAQLDLPEQDIHTPQVAAYAKKVKRRRARAAAIAVFCALLAAALLALLALTVLDMRRQSSPAIFPLEDGIFDLTAAKLTIPAADAGQYVLFTNTTKIQVTADDGAAGTVTLWDAASDGGYIQIYELTADRPTCTFENLTAARNYRVECDGLGDAEVTISDARSVSFWRSFRTVLRDVCRQIA